MYIIYMGPVPFSRGRRVWLNENLYVPAGGKLVLGYVKNRSRDQNPTTQKARLNKHAWLQQHPVYPAPAGTYCSDPPITAAPSRWGDRPPPSSSSPAPSLPPQGAGPGSAPGEVDSAPPLGHTHEDSPVQAALQGAACCSAARCSPLRTHSAS